MFFDRWSTKVQLPLGAKWGNNIGGVAACLNWSGGREPKPPKLTKTVHTNDHYQVSRNNYNNYLKNDPHDFDTNKWSDDRYIQIVPWKEDLGMMRDHAGNLQVTGRSGNRHNDDLHEDLLVGAVHDVARRQETGRGALPPRPPTGKKSIRAGAGYKGNTPKKGYGFMGPPPPPTPPRHGVTSRYRSTTSVSRPKNPSPEIVSTKYTERELIIEDMDDVNDVGRKTPLRGQSRNASRAASTTGYRTTARSATPHRSFTNRPGSSAMQMPAGYNFTTSYQPEYSVENFSPTPLIWQSPDRFDKSIPEPKLTTTSPYLHYNPNINHRKSSQRPNTASGNSSRDVRVNVGSMNHRAVEDRVMLRPSDIQRTAPTKSSSENITIHVDCSKLVTSARPASLTVRLHGVDASDTDNIRINTVPAK